MPDLRSRTGAAIMNSQHRSDAVAGSVRRNSVSCAILLTSILLFGLALAGPLAVPVGAQAVKLIGLSVSGQIAADVQLIKNVSGLVSGMEVNQENIQAAIHNVYGLGLFADVRVLGEEVDGGVNLTIDVKELPRLNQILFEGSKEIKEKDFGLQIRRGQTIGPSRLKQAEKKVRDAYQKKGYFLVEVESELKATTVAGESDVIFRVEKNRPVKVSAVEFSGNKGLRGGALRKKMSNKPRGFLKSIFGGGKFNREKYADDKVAIIDLYAEKGYLDATILSDSIILNEEKTHVTLQIELSEGPRYYFGESVFSGMDILPEDRLVRQLRYKKGDVFNQESYEESIGRMYEAYMEEGYLYARVIDETRTTDTTVNMSFEISEGVPAHVRRIDITGNTKTKDKVIRRELAIYPGQIFRRSALQRSMRNVMVLNYFSNVVPDFKQLPDGRVDLDFKVEEKPTGQIQVGGGYSEQDKLVGTIDLGIPNLFGGGQSANLLFEFGDRRQSFRLGFTEPWFMDTPTTVGFDLQRLDRVWDDPDIAGGSDFTQRTDGASVRLGRRLRWPDDYFRVFWSYGWKNQKFTEFSSNVDERTKSSIIRSTEGVISSTSLTLIRDSRNLPEFATSGSRASYRIDFAGGLLGGDWEFVTHNLSYGFFKRIWKSFTFAPRWSLATIQGGSDLLSTPYSERFFAGGIRADGTIRGYDDRQIQARVDTTTTAPPAYTIDGDIALLDTISSVEVAVPYGSDIIDPGQAMAVMNAEITFAVVPQQIHGILFFDAGNVWLDATQVRPFSDVFSSYGFGFRLAVPGMGMLGFDFGIPLRGNDKGKLKPHFQFGGAF